jgi:hypothetical protein
MTCKACRYNNQDLDEKPKPYCDHVSANKKNQYPNATNCSGYDIVTVIQAISFQDILKNSKDKS